MLEGKDNLTFLASNGLHLVGRRRIHDVVLPADGLQRSVLPSHVDRHGCVRHIGRELTIVRRIGGISIAVLQVPSCTIKGSKVGIHAVNHTQHLLSLTVRSRLDRENAYGITVSPRKFKFGICSRYHGTGIIIPLKRLTTDYHITDITPTWSDIIYHVCQLRCTRSQQ